MALYSSAKCQTMLQFCPLESPVCRSRLGVDRSKEPCMHSSSVGGIVHDNTCRLS